MFNHANGGVRKFHDMDTSAGHTSILGSRSVCTAPCSMGTAATIQRASIGVVDHGYHGCRFSRAQFRSLQRRRIWMGGERC